MRITLPAVLSGCLLGVALAVLVHGFSEGVLWMRIVGLAAASLMLLALSWAVELSATGYASPPREGVPRAYAPAVVRSARSVDDPRGVHRGMFLFELTVHPEGRRPFGVRVLHPLDLQGLTRRRAAVVEYDPRRPWRAALPADPPWEWAARAEALAAEDEGSVPPPAAARIPPGFPVLVIGLCTGVAFTWLLSR
ncbi:hypothetical protein GCM10009801_61730 [Streptomyces albiaxialis]|uniref:DUF3592 domain-containing protein n=1 Tax=Streptomyces albiaxialis TaxID=329523 RepID=A0ABN2WMF7_9ACTN